jgi:hypothetical protein
MNFKKSSEKDKSKTISVFEFKFKKKTYKIPFRGENRRIRSFEFLLEAYPNFFNVHDERITKIYKDSNKAINEFIIQEGFQGFVLVEEKNASNDEKVNFFKLDLHKICQHLDRGGIFAKQIRKQPTKEIKEQLMKRSDSCCEITGYKLLTKNELRKRNINFLSTMLEIVFDHKIPIFKGGSDDNTKIDNWQILSWYANNEKNKVCKSCYEKNCDNCALAYPKENSIIKPTGQSLKDCKIN